MSDFFTHHFFAGARIEAQVGAVRDALERHGLYAGRMVSQSKSSYSEGHPDNLVFFNACIFIKKRRWFKSTYRQVWWGDIDLTLSQTPLVAAADDCGQDLWVTRERYRWDGYHGETPDELSVVIFRANL